MKKMTIMMVGLAFLVLGVMHQVQAAITVVSSATVPTVQATVTGVAQTLSVAVKNVSDNAAAAGGVATFPAGSSVKTSAQYLEVSFQSNTIGAAVIIDTDNRSGTANPGFCSGKDGVIGTADDEPFNPSSGASGSGLVGTAAAGHGFAVPLLWTVFDAVQPGGYTFVKDFAIEGVVTDKAQTHAFAGPNGTLIAQSFDSSANLSYASVVTNMTQDGSGANSGLIASFPQTAQGGGLRSATSPVVVYLGVDYTGAPAQGYGTNTLKLELINQ